MKIGTVNEVYDKMKKKYILIFSLIITLKTLLFGNVVLTDQETKLLYAVQDISRSEQIILTLNLPLMGEIDLYQYTDPLTHKLGFANKKTINLNLFPIPINLVDIRLIETGGNLELTANAKVFGRNAKVSLESLKRTADIKIIEGISNTKLLLDIAEMKLLFNFEEVGIKLFDGLNLNFGSAFLMLRKNKPHLFFVKNNILNQPVDFDFTFLDDGTILIKYFLTKDILLSNLSLDLKSDFNDVILKSLSLTTEYKSGNLFSKNQNFQLRGNAFADVQLFDENLPIALVDLPTTMNYLDGKYSIEMQLPQFNLPFLGSISNVFLKLSDSLTLIGEGILSLPQIGKYKYDLDAIYKYGKIQLRGKFHHSIKYENFVIEAPRFIYNSDNKSIKIFGKSKIHDIKCMIELLFKKLDSFVLEGPEIKLRSLQRSWKPFIGSDNLSLADVQLKNPKLSIVDNNGKKEVRVTARARVLKDDVNVTISFVDSAKGVIPVLKVNPSEPWKISDSFGNIKAFDDLMFVDPEFTISDTAFYDKNTHMYFRKGINFNGRLSVNQAIDPVSSLITLTEGDLMTSGFVSDDFKHFVWHAPLASGLSSKAKLMKIGPMHLELSSNAPLSIATKIFIQPTEKELLDFNGNFKRNGKKLILETIRSNTWNNVFSLSGLNMFNPKLHVTLDPNFFEANSMPDNIIIEGDIGFAGHKMHARSIMNDDFSKFSLAGHWDHFWLNDLSNMVMNNQANSQALPPLDMKNITFNISEDKGLLLDGILGLFGLNVNIHCAFNNSGLRINGILPKIVTPNLEIVGKNPRTGSQLLIDVLRDKCSAKIVGTTRFGNIIEIHDPLFINSEGCSFDSNTTIGYQKFGLKITGKSLGFIDVPNFNLNLQFKNDFIDYCKKRISAELNLLDINLNREYNALISDIKILESNVRSFPGDAEQLKILIWSLKESKLKLNRWQKLGWVRNEKGVYRYNRVMSRFNLTEIKFNGSANKITNSIIPLTFVMSLLNEKHVIEFDIDFAHLDQSITKLVQEISMSIK